MATEEEFKPLGKGLSSSLHSSAGVRRQDPPSNALVYLAPEYWDERFEEEEHYEWLKDYSHFRDLLLSHVKPTDRVRGAPCSDPFPLVAEIKSQLPFRVHLSNI
jgi:hypothetical protein